jgi:hypothetical protein
MKILEMLLVLLVLAAPAAPTNLVLADDYSDALAKYQAKKKAAYELAMQELLYRVQMAQSEGQEANAELDRIKAMGLEQWWLEVYLPEQDDYNLDDGPEWGEGF